MCSRLYVSKRYNIDSDIRCLRELLAETEGFEPSIGLYNPITV